MDIGVLCGVIDVDPSSIDCPSINCDFWQFHVRAKSNCGNQFTKFPSVDGFDISYGAVTVDNPNEENVGTDNAPLFAHNFGQHGENPEDTFIIGSFVVEFCNG